MAAQSDHVLPCDARHLVLGLWGPNLRRRRSRRRGEGGRSVLDVPALRCPAARPPCLQHNRCPAGGREGKVHSSRNLGGSRRGPRWPTSPLRTTKKLVELQVATKPCGSSISASSAPALLACGEQDRLAWAAMRRARSGGCAVLRDAQLSSQSCCAFRGGCAACQHEPVHATPEHAASWERGHPAPRWDPLYSARLRHLDARRDTVQLAMRVPARVLDVWRAAPHVAGEQRYAALLQRGAMRAQRDMPYKPKLPGLLAAPRAASPCRHTAFRPPAPALDNEARVRECVQPAALLPRQHVSWDEAAPHLWRRGRLPARRAAAPWGRCAPPCTLVR